MSSSIAAAIDNASADPPELDDRALADEPRNDYGNGRRLRARHGADMLLVDAVGWHVWDGRRFAAPPDKRAPEAQKRAHQTAMAIADEAEALEDDVVRPAERELERLEGEGSAPTPALIKEARERLKDAIDRLDSHRKFGIGSGNSGKIAAMLLEAEPYLFRRQRELNANPFLLNLRNATLDLGGRRRDGDVDADPAYPRPHHRADLITHLAPVDYDPKATCPEFDRFLATIIPDPRERAFLMRWFGYSLTGDVTEQRIVLCWGSGSNGKSTLLNAVHDAMGDYAVHLPIETFLDDPFRRAGDATPDLVRLVGARLALASEPRKGARLSESVVKQCTGGERMTARRLFEGMFDFDPTFKLTLAMNEKPTIAAQDHGTWRRVTLFPFRITLEADDKSISERLRAERAGIFNRLLDGWRDYRENGLAIPETILTATSEYRMESDPVGQFIGSEVVEEFGAREKSATLYGAYSRWAHANGFNPVSSTKFGRRLGELGWLKEKLGVGVMVYMGVRLRVAPDGSSGDDASSRDAGRTDRT